MIICSIAVMILVMIMLFGNDPAAKTVMSILNFNDTNVAKYVTTPMHCKENWYHSNHML